MTCWRACEPQPEVKWWLSFSLFFSCVLTDGRGFCMSAIRRKGAAVAWRFGTVQTHT